MRWIGDKIKNIPDLNKDQGLRRALAQGMDKVQDWASKNPKKAALLNTASGIAGGLTGGVMAGNMQQSSTQNKLPDPTGAGQSWTSPDADQYLNPGVGQSMTTPDAAQYLPSTQTNNQQDINTWNQNPDGSSRGNYSGTFTPDSPNRPGYNVTTNPDGSQNYISQPMGRKPFWLRK